MSIIFAIARDVLAVIGALWLAGALAVGALAIAARSTSPAWSPRRLRKALGNGKAACGPHDHESGSGS